MTKWEYKSVELIRSEGSSGHVYFQEVLFDAEGKTQEAKLSKSLTNTEAFANKYGKDGWELVTVQYMPPKTSMWFKKPITTSTEIENEESTQD